MALDHTVLADIDAMLVAKLVCHQSFWAFAQTHWDGFIFSVFCVIDSFCSEAYYYRINFNVARKCIAY